MKRSFYLPALYCFIVAGLLCSAAIGNDAQTGITVDQTAKVEKKKDAKKKESEKKEEGKKKEADKKKGDGKKKDAEKKKPEKKKEAGKKKDAKKKKRDGKKKADRKNKNVEKKKKDAAKKDTEKKEDVKKEASKACDGKKDEKKDDKKKDGTKAVAAIAAAAKTVAAKVAAVKKQVAATKKPTYELKKEPLVIKVSLTGVFEARKMTEVMIRPEAWSGFTVLKAAEHGKRVKRGDLLVALDTENIDKALEELQTEHRLAGLALKQAQNELKTIETVAPLESAVLERSKKIADEDYTYYFKYELPFSKEYTEFRLKANKNYLDYQKEELRQLEKMYKADEITEETEEIVLRRTRDAVEQGEFIFKAMKESADRRLKIELPREEVSQKDSHKLGGLMYRAKKALLPLALERNRVEFEKLKTQYARLDKKLKDMKGDRKLMTVKSPVDGILYHGRCVDGKWSGGSATGKLSRDTSLPVKQAFMTIVQTRPLRIVTQVAEKDLYNVRGGQKGTAKPTGYPDVKLDVIVDSVATVPIGSSFPAKITVALNKEAEPIMPGMTCGVKLMAYENKEALCVPPASLKADPLDEDKFSVIVVGKDGKECKREVKIGRRTSSKVEILEGLKVGDKILATCPKDGAKTPEKKTDAKKDATKKEPDKKDAAKKPADKK